MNSHWRIAAGLSAALAFASISGAAASPVSDRTEFQGRASAAPQMLAQMLPFERNKVENIDPRQAFVEGYEAYKRRDFIATIGRMEFAATSFPELADYALFYLASAQRDSGDAAGAAESFQRLTAAYPESIFANTACVEYARIELKQNRPDLAITAASRAALTANDPATEQNAQFILASAKFAAGDYRGAYATAQALREKYPGSSVDSDARALAHAILQAHPGVDTISPLDYSRREAALLIREGRSREALEQIARALSYSPPMMIRIELAWMSAEANRGTPRARADLAHYLALAPRGSHAATALNAIAHIYWHQGDNGYARLYFNRVASEFPSSPLAPQAMFEIGRTYEDDGDFKAARGAFLKIAGRYPQNAAAEDARFRAAFMLYMLKRYDAAAAEFANEQRRASSAGTREMLAYWQARSLEQNGELAESRQIYQRLAESTDSNYYPELAARRINATPNAFPAANVPDLVAGPTPQTQGPANFHLQRVNALRELGLRELEAPELKVIESRATDPALRTFVLAELQTSGAWYDAIGLATRMAARGEISATTAERIRYPRGYWDLVSEASLRNQLDRDMLAALIRQESLFDPNARSVSDARGLMQLLPSTAERYAGVPGISVSPLNLYDPATSVAIGSAYLRNLLTMFNGDLFKAVAAYNGGEHAVSGWIAKYPGDDDQWVENIGFRETRDYVKKVIGGMREYRLLYPSISVTSASVPTR